MRRVELTYAGGAYDRMVPLLGGAVSPAGVELNFMPMPVEEVFWRQARYAEFDVAELSLAAYVAMRSAGDDRFTAIPVFPSKSFRHRSVYVRTDSRIEHPSQLRGTKIGIPEWVQTAGVWMRGIFGEFYGLDHREASWIISGLAPGGRVDKVELNLPEELDLSWAPADATLPGMLAGGTVSAVLSARPPRALIEAGQARQLFADAAEQEREFFRGTGVVPIMHVVVVRRELVERHRWLAGSLLRAFAESAARSTELLLDDTVQSASLLWTTEYARAERATFGAVFEPGYPANRAALEMFVGYARQQHIADASLAVAELFEESTLSTEVV
jgi:4,5-dihydroxyphthalate decarboxylase